MLQNELDIVAKMYPVHSDNVDWKLLQHYLLVLFQCFYNQLSLKCVNALNSDRAIQCSNHVFYQNGWVFRFTRKTLNIICVVITA